MSKPNHTNLSLTLLATAWPLSTRPALGPGTLAWDTLPGSGWRSHRHPTGHTTVDSTACWDEARRRRTTEIVTNLRISRDLSDQPPAARSQRRTGKRRPFAKMMEEIDRFQVPSAVQEAEMQAEMQPLVSLVADPQSAFRPRVLLQKRLYYRRTLGARGPPFITLRSRRAPSPAVRNAGRCTSSSFFSKFIFYFFSTAV